MKKNKKITENDLIEYQNSQDFIRDYSGDIRDELTYYKTKQNQNRYDKAIIKQIKREIWIRSFRYHFTKHI